MHDLPGYGHLPGLGPACPPLTGPVCKMCHRPSHADYVSKNYEDGECKVSPPAVKLAWSEHGLVCGPCFTMLQAS